jgi:hypothetical protein
MTTTTSVLAFLSEELESYGAESNPLHLGGRLFDSALAYLRTHGCQNRDVIRSTLGVAYDTHIRPLDLPGIPNFLEPRVDDMIKQALLGLYDRAADDFCRPENTPTEDLDPPPVRPGS